MKTGKQKAWAQNMDMHVPSVGCMNWLECLRQTCMHAYPMLMAVVMV